MIAPIFLLPWITTALLWLPRESAAITITPKLQRHASAIMGGFLLLDENGKELAARVPGLDIAPFGALLRVSDKGTSTCTATHLKNGRILTAAHCIGQGPDDLHILVFYDKKGVKSVAPVESIQFVGDAEFDFAVLRIADELAATWDEGGNRLVHYEQKSLDAPDGPDDGVTIWSYTPIEHFPDYKARYPHANSGMVFRPNRCLASQIRPKLEAWTGSKKKKNRRKLSTIHLGDKIPPGDHIFLDQCRYRIEQGNSGSLVTFWNNFHHKLGPLHCIIAEKEQVFRTLKSMGYESRGVDLVYRGVTNKIERIAWNMGRFLVGVASLFDGARKRSREALAGI